MSTEVQTNHEVTRPEARHTTSLASLKLVEEAYLTRCSAEKRLSRKTVKAYRCDIDQYLEWAQARGCGFDKGAVKAYLSHLNASFAASSVRRKLATLRAWANWLLREHYIYVSPFKELDISIRKPILLPRTIAKSDLRLMMNPEGEAPSGAPATQRRDERGLRDQAVLELLIATGARVSEVCALDIESVDMVAKTVRIFGKGSKERLVYLGSVHTLEALEGYLAYRWRIDEEMAEGEPEKGRALFLNSTRTRLGEQGVRDIIRKRAEETGVQAHITPHMFRHTFATALLENDVDIRYIQRLLGHSSIKTTERYIYTASSKLREIMEARNPRDTAC